MLVPRMPQAQLRALANDVKPKNPSNEEDGILLVVLAQFFGDKIWALIDSSATRRFVSLVGAAKCGLMVETQKTFLELGNDTKACNTPSLCFSFFQGGDKWEFPCQPNCGRNKWRWSFVKDRSSTKVIPHRMTN